MKYYALRDENGKLLSVGVTSSDKISCEITGEEYELLSDGIRQRCMLVEQLYGGAISIDDVPAEWQEEVQQGVDRRLEADAKAETASKQEISDDELAAMLEEVL